MKEDKLILNFPRYQCLSNIPQLLTNTQNKVHSSLFTLTIFAYFRFVFKDIYIDLVFAPKNEMRIF